METNAYKERLTEEAARLEAELAEVGNRNPKNPVDWEAKPQETGQEADPNDAADQMEGFGENAAVLEDLEIRYRAVKGALERIEAGTYGVCSVGGEAIQSDRLDADPAAATCTVHMTT